MVSILANQIKLFKFKYLNFYIIRHMATLLLDSSYKQSLFKGWHDFAWVAAKNAPRIA